MKIKKEQQARKKAYRAPRLKEYGSIREITRAIGDKTKTADNSVGKFNKT